MGSNVSTTPRAGVVICVLALVSLWGAAATAGADQTTAAAPAATDAPSPVSLQTILVTARRRKELLQDVPVAVTAYTADSLRQLDANNIKDTLGITPGLYFTGNNLSPTDSFQQLVIRGIGANSQLEPSVGTFVDGVYMPALDFDIGFLDVDHIEVLKGPQGALFGRNTEGGAVNMVLRQPDDTYRSRVTVSYDNFNTAETDASLSGPLVEDKLFASFSGKLQQSDYWIRQTGTAQYPTDPYFPGQNLIKEYDPLYNPINSADGQRDAEFRVALRYVPRDDLEIDLSGHDARSRGIGQGAGPLDGCKCYTIYDSGDYQQTQDAYGAELALKKKFAPAALSITLADESAASSEPYDYTGTTVLAGNFSDYYRTQTILSAEVRLTSTTDSPLQWLVGLYGFHDHDFTDRFYIWSDLAEPGFLNIYSGLWNLQHTDISRPGGAAYGQVSYDFTPKLQLAVGGRYSWERATDTALTAFQIPDNGLLPYTPSTAYGWQDYVTPVQSSGSWSNFSPQAQLRYKWLPDFMTYINIAEGFKAGSYQIAPVTPSEVVPVAPEKTINYELGTKVGLFDHRLYVDGDIYYIKLKDQQLQSVIDVDGVLTSAITTASSSHVEGAELSLTGRPTKRLTLSANAAYTLAEFDDYLINPEPGVLVNRGGQQEPNTPLWTYFLSADYNVPVDGHALELSANYRYVDSISVGGGTGPSDPLLPVPSWSQLDVAGTLHFNDWQIRLFCDNVTNRYIILNKDVPFTTPLDAFVHDIVAPPRRFGIAVTYQLR